MRGLQGKVEPHLLQTLADRIVAAILAAARGGAGMELSQKTVAKILIAFDAMVIVPFWGQPCYRTANDVPMGMPKAVEKKVRAALRALKRGR